MQTVCNYMITFICISLFIFILLKSFPYSSTKVNTQRIYNDVSSISIIHLPGIKSCNNKCSLILTSPMYGDASGKDEWAIRGPDIFPKTWRLTRKNSNSSTRILDTGHETFQLTPSDDGYKFSNQSS